MAATGESRGAEIRRRNVAKATNIPSKSLPETCSTEHAEDKPLDTKRNLTYAYSLKPGTYWLTRIVLLRFLGFIYCEFRLVPTSVFNLDISTYMVYCNKIGIIFTVLTYKIFVIYSLLFNNNLSIV